MKKFLLGIAGVIALAAPASAADLAARPYTKAPAMIAAVYDWSGFYIGANGGWGSSRKCWDQHLNFCSAAGRRPAKAATTRAVASPAVRSVIAGRRARGCSASKPKATGRISGAQHQPGRLCGGAGGLPIAQASTHSACLPARSATRSTTRCSMSRAALPSPMPLPGRRDRHQHRRCHHRLATPVGAAPSASVSNTASPRTGRLPSIRPPVHGHSAPTLSQNGWLIAPPVRRCTDRIRQDVDLVTVRVNYRWGGPVVAKY